MSAPTLSEIIRAAVDAGAARMRVHLPARIESYDAATSTCSVRVLVPDLHEDADGEATSGAVQVMEGVPFKHLRAGGFSLTFKPKKGDEVLLLFMDRSMDMLFTTGQEGEPGDSRRHHLMDAIAVPAFHVAGETPADADTTSIGAESSPGSPGLRIHFTDGAISIGEASPTYSVALAQKVEQRLSRIEAAFNNHVHATAAPGTPSPPTPVPLVIPVESPAGTGVVGSVASSTVKVKG